MKKNYIFKFILGENEERADRYGAPGAVQQCTQARHVHDGLCSAHAPGLSPASVVAAIAGTGVNDHSSSTEPQPACWMSSFSAVQIVASVWPAHTVVANGSAANAALDSAGRRSPGGRKQARVPEY